MHRKESDEAEKARRYTKKANPNPRGTVATHSYVMGRLRIKRPGPLDHRGAKLDFRLSCFSISPINVCSKFVSHSLQTYPSGVSQEKKERTRENCRDSSNHRHDFRSLVMVEIREYVIPGGDHDRSSRERKIRCARNERELQTRREEEQQQQEQEERRGRNRATINCQFRSQFARAYQSAAG